MTCPVNSRKGEIQVKRKPTCCEKVLKKGKVCKSCPLVAFWHQAKWCKQVKR